MELQAWGSIVCFTILLFSAVVAIPLPLEISSSHDLKKRSHSGKMTWFKPGMGNCGKHNTEHDMIVALPTHVYSHGQHCDKDIKIWTKSGKSVKAVIRDSCPSCGSGDLDVSPAVFKKFASLGKGVEKISWEIL